jgi:hypothetical protein
MVDTDETVNGYSKFTEQTSFFYSRFLASTTRAYDSTTSIALAPRSYHLLAAASNRSTGRHLQERNQLSNADDIQFTTTCDFVEILTWRGIRTICATFCCFVHHW